MAAFLLSDSHAFRIVAIGAEGRGPGRTDPLGAPLVPTLLFLEPLAERLHQLVPAAERFDLRFLFFGQQALGEFFEPFPGQLDLRHLRACGGAFEPLEALGKDAIEFVEMPLILHQRGAGQIVETLGIVDDEVLLHRLQQSEIFAQGAGHLRVAEREEEVVEHGRSIHRRGGQQAAAQQHKREEEGGQSEDDRMGDRILPLVGRLSAPAFGAPPAKGEAKAHRRDWDHPPFPRHPDRGATPRSSNSCRQTAAARLSRP